MQFNSRRSPVLSKNGMIATSQPLAAMSGLKILMEGGNAVDGAIAAAAALAVVEPGSTGIGGDLFAMVWDSKTRSVKALNASGRAPMASSIDGLRNQGYSYIPNDSPHSVTVPGTVDGWATLLDAYGSMSLSEVLSPAINYAETGYPVSPLIAQDFARAFPKLTRHASGQELLLDGLAPRAGQLMTLPELAMSLRTIAEGGAEAFYRGPMAQRIAAYIQEQGGWLTTDDLSQHTSTWDEPISTNYRGITCWECPPNSQGLTALMALNLTEGYDIASMGRCSANMYHHLIESMRLALADGLHFIADPSRVPVPLDKLLSKVRSMERRSLITADRAMTQTPYDPNIQDADTVYVTCIDSHGNACSLINSLFQAFGTGLIVPDTGIALQNRGSLFSLDPEHPNSLAPGKRPYHTIIPGMATKDDELWLSFGVMGGFHQAQGHLQVLVNMIDFGLDPQTALDSRRFNVNLDDTTTLEQDSSDSVIRDLRKRGHQITADSGKPDVFFGGGQIIQRNADTGILTAGSDPRKDGCAVGW